MRSTRTSKSALPEQARGGGVTNSAPASSDTVRVSTVDYDASGNVQDQTDQNGSVHDDTYDLLGRQIEDQVSTLGTDVDGFVRRIEWSFDNRNRLENIASYSAASGGSVRSDVQYAYNDFSQLQTEYQQHGSAVNTGTSPQVQYGYANGSSNTIRRESMTYPTPSKVLNFASSSGVGDKLSRVEKQQLIAPISWPTTTSESDKWSFRRTSNPRRTTLSTPWRLARVAIRMRVSTALGA